MVRRPGGHLIGDLLTLESDLDTGARTRSLEPFDLDSVHDPNPRPSRDSLAHDVGSVDQASSRPVAGIVGLGATLFV